jgi:hypothetical protein
VCRTKIKGDVNGHNSVRLFECERNYQRKASDPRNVDLTEGSPESK